jgi:hypothetical protein
MLTQLDAFALVLALIETNKETRYLNTTQTQLIPAGS